MNKQIKTFCIAFGKKTILGDFSFFDSSFGSSKGIYNSKNYYELKLDVIAKKKIMVFEIYKFIKFFKLKDPNLIKIDVDGGEYEVLLGAIKLLKYSRRLKSILVEFDENYNSFSALEKLLKKYNWEVSEKYFGHPGVNNLILKKKNRNND
jgi:FkbM family methyltransferase